MNFDLDSLNALEEERKLVSLLPQARWHPSNLCII